jgi:hypothetical protein
MLYSEPFLRVWFEYWSVTGVSHSWKRAHRELESMYKKAIDVVTLHET